MTKQRKAIIDLFKENSGKALSAEMMYHLVGDDKMNLSTVYRTMDKLLEAKLINKTVVNTVAYFFLAESENNKFMIFGLCEECI
jgi:Fur family ferric uptake transcriptional regulator